MPPIAVFQDGPAPSSSSGAGGRASLMRWLMNSSVSIRPWPVVSFVLYTSMWVSLARRRILHTPSSSIFVLSPAKKRTTGQLSSSVLPPAWEPHSLLEPEGSGKTAAGRIWAEYNRADSHSRKEAAKFVQMLPSHCRPRRATVSGIEATSMSSTRCRIPSRERKPTMMRGTPSRNDWIQNLSSLRSKLSRSRSLRISADVLSSTQLMGSPALGGLESQTAGARKQEISCHLSDDFVGPPGIIFEIDKEILMSQ